MYNKLKTLTFFLRHGLEYIDIQASRIDKLEDILAHSDNRDVVSGALGI